MTTWRAFLNDKLPDCGVAACCNAMLLWNTASPNDDDAKTANDRFSSAGGNSKVLWGWLRRGIGGNYLGGFARIKPSQVPDAVKRFGCAFVAFDTFRGVGPHAVLAIPAGYVSWGQEFVDSGGGTISEAYAIAPHWHPILLWWSITNFWLRFQ